MMDPLQKRKRLKKVGFILVSLFIIGRLLLSVIIPLPIYIEKLWKVPYVHFKHILSLQSFSELPGLTLKSIAPIANPTQTGSSWHRFVRDKNTLYAFYSARLNTHQPSSRNNPTYAYLVKSHDNGLSWSDEITIGKGRLDNAGVEETSGNLFVKLENLIYFSENKGDSWSSEQKSALHFDYYRYHGWLGDLKRYNAFFDDGKKRKATSSFESNPIIYTTNSLFFNKTFSGNDYAYGYSTSKGKLLVWHDNRLREYKDIELKCDKFCSNQVQYERHPSLFLRIYSDDDESWGLHYNVLNTLDKALVYSHLDDGILYVILADNGYYGGLDDNHYTGEINLKNLDIL